MNKSPAGRSSLRSSRRTEYVGVLEVSAFLLALSSPEVETEQYKSHTKRKVHHVKT